MQEISSQQSTDPTTVTYVTVPNDNDTIYIITQPNKNKDKSSVRVGHSTNLTIIRVTKSSQTQTSLKNMRPRNEVFRERSIEEIEAANDLLSLSQSLLQCDATLCQHERKHLDLPLIICQKCGRLFLSTALRFTIYHSLTPKQTYSCGVCGKLFSQNALLKRHFRSHSGEKPFRCTHCDKVFGFSSTLWSHKQTHSHIKQYECTKCQKSFALKTYLKKHSILCSAR